MSALHVPLQLYFHAVRMDVHFCYFHAIRSTILPALALLSMYAWAASTSSSGNTRSTIGLHSQCSRAVKTRPRSHTRARTHAHEPKCAVNEAADARVRELVRQRNLHNREHAQNAVKRHRGVTLLCVAASAHTLYSIERLRSVVAWRRMRLRSRVPSSGPAASGPPSKPNRIQRASNAALAAFWAKNEPPARQIEVDGGGRVRRTLAQG